MGGQFIEQKNWREEAGQKATAVQFKLEVIKANNTQFEGRQSRAHVASTVW